MKPQEPQSYANHARFVPTFHFLCGGLLLGNFIWSVYQLFVMPVGHSVHQLGVAVALMLLFFWTRQFSLTVQDRVIRLEEWLRLTRLLPVDLQPRINQFSFDQLIALRFASDGELPDLARRVLDQRIQDKKTIKQMIQTWRPDTLRA